ncbi:MAG: AAA family ATPase, partial [Muribaculaceae bacterium]|nr:AAA family ATPase [Muribaculaceae bacterium]
VLSGGAGTGKTAVVSFFLSSQTILNEGVLLLAPTGKARVRLSTQTNGDKRIKALTIAQFLIRHNRYDGKTMHPISNCNAEQYSEARNIIIDECSMLTENDLFVLFEALDMKRIKRIILIGDPSQLPPIGPGRPFADFCNLIRFNSDDNKYSSLKDALAELKTVVRTVNGEASDILSLAAWYSHEKPAKDSVNIFDKIESNSLNKDLGVVSWNNAEDLTVKLKQALCHELNCNDKDLEVTLRNCLGLDNLDKLKENAAVLDNLQILTPVRNTPWGVYLLNQTIQKWIHTGRDVPSVQISNQTILEGDKVMQLRNEKRQADPSQNIYQLSNGQIGFIYSINKTSNQLLCNVNFNGLPIQTFGYKPMKGDEGEPPIELAYAISIHKSQGSDFNTVIVVLPKSGRNLSRELIYTALTRAKEKVILLLEENINWLYAKSKPEASMLGARRTNLFKYSIEPELKENQYRTEGLIHRTKPDANNRVTAVRSKSEVIIANEIISAGIPFKYEEPLDDNKGKYLLPDFTFVDDSGETIIWEHLGMLGVPAYREAWERKLKRYQDMGFEEGENLFVTKDNPDGSFNSEEVIKVINEIKKLMI